MNQVNFIINLNQFSYTSSYAVNCSRKVDICEIKLETAF